MVKDSPASMITDAIEEAQKQPKSREMSLVITKLEEALLWYGAQKPVEHPKQSA